MSVIKENNEKSLKFNIYHYIYYRLSQAGSYFDKINKTDNYLVLLFPIVICTLYIILIIDNICFELIINIKTMNIITDNYKICIIILAIVVGLFQFTYLLKNSYWKTIRDYYKKLDEKKQETRIFNEVVLMSLIFAILFAAIIFWASSIRERYMEKNGMVDIEKIIKAKQYDPNK